MNAEDTVRSLGALAEWTMAVVCAAQRTGPAALNILEADFRRFVVVEMARAEGWKWSRSDD